MDLKKIHLGWIGFGHMAEALHHAFDRAKIISRSNVLFHRKDHKRAKEVEQRYGITSTSLEGLIKESEYILLAVRPNQIGPILERIHSWDLRNKKFISILAGASLAYFEKFLGKEVEILRTLPNLGSLVFEGMTVLSYNKKASASFQEVTKTLFSSVGPVLEIKESCMDIACALMGSSPGLVFRLIESLAKLGEKEGLAFEEALVMVAQSFLGAAKLVLKEKNVEKLIQAIAVPGGTTEAGLSKMKQEEVEHKLQEAALAVKNRSSQIAQEFSRM